MNRYVGSNVYHCEVCCRLTTSLLLSISIVRVQLTSQHTSHPLDLQSVLERSSQHTSHKPQKTSSETYSSLEN